MFDNTRHHHPVMIFRFQFEVKLLISANIIIILLIQKKNVCLITISFIL